MKRSWIRKKYVSSSLEPGVVSTGFQEYLEYSASFARNRTLMPSERTIDVNDDHYMALALAQAEAARAVDEVPVGALIVREGSVLAAAHNQREQLHDPTAHAEMIAITQAAAALGSWRLEGCTLYVTLEPCPMCAGAILQARLSKIVFGAEDPKAGAVRSCYQLLSDARMNHSAEVVGGVMSESCGKILTDFFTEKRQQGKK